MASSKLFLKMFVKDPNTKKDQGEYSTQHNKTPGYIIGIDN